ncbi:MAG: hypothetical protein JO293_01825 [Candidatus Eremiobacteraeota bacterium]|nr:hypothetical protein [Candidatus Eremiobacteraeota bacterium]MBV8222074.1 hypothetical protein [Candidatus Eremiobacteraeota bacterium]MBV8280810.1 hypothetical protein [Candidatus Eremiobacteraeota bacterium]
MPDQDAPQTPAVIPAAPPAQASPAAATAPPSSAQSTNVPAAGAPHADSHMPSVGEALSNLAHLIPGFAGYKAVEDRRIADKQLRATIGERLTGVQDRLDAVVDATSRAGSLDGIALVDQSKRRLGRLIDRMRFADYGYSAVFDRVQLGDPELARLYQYDTAIMNELPSFDGAVANVEASAGDPAKLGAALQSFDALTAEFDRRFEARQHLFDPLVAPQS